MFVSCCVPYCLCCVVSVAALWSCLFVSLFVCLFVCLFLPLYGFGGVDFVFRFCVFVYLP